MACLQTSCEVHIKRVALVVIGKTTGPKEQLFVAMYDNWNDFTVDSNHSGIDYENRQLFDWRNMLEPG